ncbi:MAG: hypothetical protein ACKOBW_04635 [Planctomycetota bacterium]
MKNILPLAAPDFSLEPLGDSLCQQQLPRVQQLPRMQQLPRVKHWLCLLVLLLLVTGCGRRNQDYVPTATDARRALEMALTQWKNGSKPGEPMQSPDARAMIVELFDGDFSSGARLLDWRIESEGGATSGPLPFQVTIQVAPQGAAAPLAAAASDSATTGSPLAQKVTYYVTGVSGRFAVFRDKEYEIRSSQM